MKTQILAVHDRAADTFGRPIFAAAIGQAIRSFQDEINRVADNNEMNRHPDDFDLYHLGTFDDTAGTFENLPGGPKQVAIGKQLRTTG